ncbi:hypothetical protein H920_12957 [Fukomys damarensis]|uniref:Uncharacterized protein n=1 Tax=Fukomys damarensis TaxID=885580 RepID=A0A091D5B0_FUKDA|nr:hypothetical protein H920_12957 [Fukomys damarensis]
MQSAKEEHKYLRAEETGRVLRIPYGYPVSKQARGASGVPYILSRLVITANLHAIHHFHLRFPDEENEPAVKLFAHTNTAPESRKTAVQAIGQEPWQDQRQLLLTRIPPCPCPLLPFSESTAFPEFGLPPEIGPNNLAQLELSKP